MLASNGTLLKRRPTRHVSEVTAIATEFGNSAKIIVPRSWLRKRVIASFFPNIPQNILMSEKQMSSEPLLSSIIPFFPGSGVAGFFMGMFLSPEIPCNNYRFILGVVFLVI